MQEQGVQEQGVQVQVTSKKQILVLLSRWHKMISTTQLSAEPQNLMTCSSRLPASEKKTLVQKLAAAQAMNLALKASLEQRDKKLVKSGGA